MTNLIFMGRIEHHKKLQLSNTSAHLPLPPQKGGKRRKKAAISHMGSAGDR